MQKFVRFHAIQKPKSGCPTKFEKRAHHHHHHFLSNFHQILININVRKSTTKYKISRNSLNSVLSYICHKIFVTHIHTHKHIDIFRKYSNLVQYISKTIKSESLEFFKKYDYVMGNAEESGNGLEASSNELCPHKLRHCHQLLKYRRQIGFSILKNRGRNLSIPKTFKKAERQRYLLSDFHQKLTNINLY